MSWLEQIESVKYSIITGDGEVFYPLWRGASKSREFNTSAFEFIDVHGTLVVRKKPKSDQLDLKFWFQGEDYINEANRFEFSANDSRPWTLTHPIYGTVIGQPLSIKRDDENLNIVEFTIPFWETIEEDYPIINYSVKDNSRDRYSEVYEACAKAYVTNNPLKTSDIVGVTDSVNNMAGEMVYIQNSSTYSNFQNQLAKTISAAFDLVNDPFVAMQNVQNFIDLVSAYEMVVETRISTYASIFNRLVGAVSTVAEKKYFESTGASLIASMALAAVTPLAGDYKLTSKIASISSQIQAVYSQYVQVVNNAYVSVYNVNQSYSPDALVQTKLADLVNYTVANLFQMTFESKRERIINVDSDTNIILLVHRYIGLDASDANIQEFKEINDIRFNELFVIKKGREIRYIK